jgi:hypothetical protein
LKLVKRLTRDSINIEERRDEVEKVALKMIQQAEGEKKKMLRKERSRFVGEWNRSSKN